MLKQSQIFSGGLLISLMLHLCASPIYPDSNRNMEAENERISRLLLACDRKADQDAKDLGAVKLQYAACRAEKTTLVEKLGFVTVGGFVVASGFNPAVLAGGLYLILTQ